jgi:hypothetical protein
MNGSKNSKTYLRTVLIQHFHIVPVNLNSKIQFQKMIIKWTKRKFVLPRTVRTRSTIIEILSAIIMILKKTKNYLI